MSKTIDEVKEAKQELADKIKAAIYEFYEESECGLNFVSVDFATTMSGKQSPIVQVSVGI